MINLPLAKIPIFCRRWTSLFAPATASTMIPLLARGKRTWKHGSMPGRERFRAEMIRGEAALRKRRRGEKSDCLGEGDRNRHATDTRRSIGQSGRRWRSPDRVTKTIEDPKLRKRVVEMLSLHQTGVEAATTLSALRASLPIKIIGNFRGNKTAMLGLLTPVLLSRRIQRGIVRRR